MSHSAAAGVYHPFAIWTFFFKLVSLIFLLLAVLRWITLRAN